MATGVLRRLCVGEHALCEFPHRRCFVCRRPVSRSKLSDCWVRELVWRRSDGLSDEQRQDLAVKIRQLPLESLIKSVWPWYACAMLRRRDCQWRGSGDRRDIVAIDGNAKLHRRTCGQPFAEARPWKPQLYFAPTRCYTMLFQVFLL